MTSHSAKVITFIFIDYLFTSGAQYQQQVQYVPYSTASNLILFCLTPNNNCKISSCQTMHRFAKKIMQLREKNVINNCFMNNN